MKPFLHAGSRGIVAEQVNTFAKRPEVKGYSSEPQFHGNPLNNQRFGEVRYFENTPLHRSTWSLR